MGIWAIQSRKYKQKNIDKENLLAAKIDKTEYNNFIENKKKWKKIKGLEIKRFMPKINN